MRQGQRQQPTSPDVLAGACATSARRAPPSHSPLPGLWSEAPPQAGSGGLSIPTMACRAGWLGVREGGARWEEGPGAFSVPSEPCAGLEEACWWISVEDGGEDTLHTFKRIHAGDSCSVPCWATSWPVERPSVTRALRERTAALSATEARAPAPALAHCPLQGRDIGTADALKGRGDGWRGVVSVSLGRAGHWRRCVGLRCHCS